MQIYSDKKAISRRKRIFRIKIYLGLFLLGLIFFGIYYLMIYSSIFKIRSIVVENNKLFSEADIIEMIKPIVLSGKIGSIAGFNNLLAWPGGKITVPNLGITDINIDKNWFQRTVKVEVNERQRFVIWCVAPSTGSGQSGQNCYWMDKRGIVFGEAPSTEGSLVSVVFDSRSDDMILGSSVEDSRFIGNLISILENLNTLDLQIDKINFNNDLQELSVSSVGGPTIIFGIRFDSAKRISDIEGLDYKKYKYVKINVENRIFLCPQNVNSCSPN